MKRVCSPLGMKNSLKNSLPVTAIKYLVCEAPFDLVKWVKANVCVNSAEHANLLKRRHNYKIMRQKEREAKRTLYKRILPSIRKAAKRGVTEYVTYIPAEHRNFIVSRLKKRKDFGKHNFAVETECFVDDKVQLTVKWW